MAIGRAARPLAKVVWAALGAAAAGQGGRRGHGGVDNTERFLAFLREHNIAVAKMFEPGAAWRGRMSDTLGRWTIGQPPQCDQGRIGQTLIVV